MTAEALDERIDVLVRAADAGDTYLAWRSLDALDDPRAARLDATVVDAAIEQLDVALVAKLSNEESHEAAAARAMQAGALTTLAQERELAATLAEAIVPPRLIDDILAKSQEGRCPRLRLTPSPRLARVPWEVLRTGDRDQRLLDIVDIVYDPPATVRTERSTPARGWLEHSQYPALFIIDPETPGHPHAEPVVSLDTRAARLIGRQLQGYLDSNGAVDDEQDLWVGGQNYTRTWLSEALIRTPRSRMFYYGHVSAEPDEPGSASLHLSDVSGESWGMARPLGTHLPLSALDLLLGTTTAGKDDPGSYPHAKSAAGQDIWPMPSRVAIIACEGGADYRSRETFGLVIAMLNAGAELVTTTRWTLPTDLAFWRFHDSVRERRIHPTTELALVVDRAHTLDDPIAALTEWQRGQLNSWRETGAIEYSPLVWASLTNTWGPDATTLGRESS
ncbi:CHAT domain-containing protein [Mycolicibacterium cosmeticum]|uniref:CHAT domain-containing protein n=1 Tax=Mycolicibacterium cosmeticum TaxID=258533 RepID=UPI003204AF6D